MTACERSVTTRARDSYQMKLPTKVSGQINSERSLSYEKTFYEVNNIPRVLMFFNAKHFILSFSTAFLSHVFYGVVMHF